ncbi:MAG TPA: hypothetical protein VK488_01620 [Gaiellaceae bacterium]|nr:hypothetical protein [Gaiellaceae bacterium]
MLAGFITTKSEAQGVAFPQLRTGQPVALGQLTSPRVEKAYLLGKASGRAFYRVDVRGQGQCFGVGPADAIGDIGEFACGFSGFPTAEYPVIYDAVVGADGPGRVLKDSDMRLYRLNVIAADGITEVKVAGSRIIVRNNVGSITFREAQPLGLITSFDAAGHAVDTYDLRPQE